MFVINEVTILIWLLCGIGSFLIAQNRGATNAPTWFLVGVLLGPIGIILAAIGAKGDGPVGGVAAIGAADELGKLAALRDQGTITADEFDRQKPMLLARPAGPASEPMTGARRNVYIGIVVFLVAVLIWLLANM